MSIKSESSLQTRITRLEAENARLRAELEAERRDDGEASPAPSARVAASSAAAVGHQPVAVATVEVDELTRSRMRDAELCELERAKREADAANRSKSEFLANMSHEIRTPMTAILGYADVLLSHLDDPDNRHCVETIKRNGAFLLEIINDILDLSKIEAGKFEIDTDRVAPDEIVAEVTSLMHVRAREKQIPLLVRYQGDLPETIETDPTRLRQILVNLVGNAIKFTDEGEVSLEIDFLDGPDPKIRFRVVDTGIGIDQREQDKLFEPFAQGDTSVTREFGGTGLGLTICRRLVERLGGELDVDSSVGEGSTFSVTIATGPLDEVAMVEPRRGITIPDSPSAGPIPNIDHRVLVVDDRHEIRFLARYFIEKAGGEVVTRTNGKEALECILEAMHGGASFDAVVMDMQMPIMDGYEASRRLRHEGYRGTIVALTANAMRGDRRKCLDAGCSAYVRKPIDGRRLVELLARHVAGNVIEEEPAEQPEGESMSHEDPGHGESPSSPKTSAQPAGDKSSSRRILLVDDSVDLGEALSMLLKMRGHEVQVCLNGKTAVETAPEFEPDVVLLDLGLPDMDGYTVLRELKKLDSVAGARFIAVSGRAGEDERKRSLHEGFEYHVVKPVTASELTKLF